MLLPSPSASFFLFLLFAISEHAQLFFLLEEMHVYILQKRGQRGYCNSKTLHLFISYFAKILTCIFQPTKLVGVISSPGRCRGSSLTCPPTYTSTNHRGLQQQKERVLLRQSLATALKRDTTAHHIPHTQFSSPLFTTPSLTFFFQIQYVTFLKAQFVNVRSIVPVKIRVAK